MGMKGRLAYGEYPDAEQNLCEECGAWIRRESTRCHECADTNRTQYGVLPEKLARHKIPLWCMAVGLPRRR